MQNWPQPGTGRSADSEAEREPTQPPANPSAAPDEPAEWDELTPTGAGRPSPTTDVLVAGRPLDRPVDRPGETFDAPTDRPTGRPTGQPTGPTAAGPESAHGGGKTVLEPDAADSFQARWRDVQFGFVDDPREAVQQADELAAEVLSAFTAALRTRKDSLAGGWRDDEGELSDTERLRLTVRAYREFIDRLLTT